MNESGVYEILNILNGKRYVGSAINLRDRKRQHWTTLRGNYHSNRHLQNSWNKYGKRFFEFSVLEYWEPELLISFEQWWMNMLCPKYNICKVAGNTFGMKPTDATKAKIGAIHKGNQYFLGRKHTDETKAKIGMAQRGRKHTEEHKAKISKSQMGNKKSLGYKHTPEARANMSAAQRGRKTSDEHKAKISAALMGRKLTDKHKARLSAAAKKRPPMSDETRAKISASNKGKKHTDKTKSKISASQVRRLAKENHNA